MAIFGRNTARQRLRRAAEESLSIPAFKTPAVDCTPWVTGGLWPAELSIVTPETAPLVKYLKADLHRIVTSANEELKKIRCAGLIESERLAHEARVINEARAYAARRVESSVRQLHSMTTKPPAPARPVDRPIEAQAAPRFKLIPPPPDIPDTPESLTTTTEFDPADEHPARQAEPGADPAYRDLAAAKMPNNGEIADAAALTDPYDSDETTQFATLSSPDSPQIAEPPAPDTQIDTAATDSDETTKFATPDPHDYAPVAEPVAPDAQIFTAPVDSDETTEFAALQPLDHAPVAEPMDPDAQILTAATDFDEAIEVASSHSADYDEAPEPALDAQIDTAATESDETTQFAAPDPLDYAPVAEPAALDTPTYAAPEFDEPAGVATPHSANYHGAPEPTSDAQTYTAATDSGETAEIPAPRPQHSVEITEPPFRDTPTPRPQDMPSSLTPDDTQALDEIASLMQEFSAALNPPPTPPVPPPAPPPPEPTFDPTSPPHIDLEPSREDTHAARPAQPPPPSETAAERLERLVLFVARQQPGLQWAAGTREDGTTLLLTDFAHGWVPPGINLPADVVLLEPGRRYGTADTLLGQTEASAVYTPGDPLGWSADDDITATSPQPRTLPPVDDPGWVLSDATHWRDGLPRMVSTLAKSAVRGTGIIAAELNVLRGYLDAARHQLFAQYPAVDDGLLLNCLLLAATERVASADWTSANYHLAWFLKLSSSDTQ